MKKSITFIRQKSTVRPLKSYYIYICQIQTATRKAIKSQSNPTTKANLPFEIPAAAVYIANTYKVVSLEPIIVEATLPTKESGPLFLKISVKNPSAPPPEILRITPIGITSAGTLIFENTGVTSFTKISIPPRNFK